jgi:hypothetical protein
MTLECGRAVSQSEGHDSVLEQSVACPKRSQLLGIRGDTDTVESLTDVQLREDLGLA